LESAFARIARAINLASRRNPLSKAAASLSLIPEDCRNLAADDFLRLGMTQRYQQAYIDDKHEDFLRDSPANFPLDK